MGGKPCIRGTRVTVGTILGLLASGQTIDDILADYPYLGREDVLEALAYAWPPGRAMASSTGKINSPEN